MMNIFLGNLSSLIFFLIALLSWHMIKIKYYELIFESSVHDEKKLNVTEKLCQTFCDVWFGFDLCLEYLWLVHTHLKYKKLQGIYTFFIL